jgi:acetolactate synthase-1/2/3 large subunit
MDKNKQMKGCDIVIKCLELHGVETIFAYPGGQSLELHQALQRSDKIRVILPRHEQGGAFAADGFARASGKVGVCMATSGPGATNLVTGIADAYMDSVPVVFITGQVPTTLIGKNAFQETDIIGITRPIVKHSYLVLDAMDLPRIMKEAFYLAAEGRPGPVMVDVPKNVQQQLCEPDFDAPMSLEYYNPAPKPSAETIELIRAAIRKSKRPCIYSGGGIITAEAAGDLLKFAESYNIPLTTTLMGLGVMPASHPLNLRWLGMHGTVYANNAANECDLLLAFGARFDDRVTGNPKTFAEGAYIIHVDIDQSEINKNKTADLAVVADIKAVLQALNENPEYQENSAWHQQIRQWKTKFPLTYKKKPGKIQPQFVVEKLWEMTGGNAIIVPGVGQHQMFSAQYYIPNAPRHFLTSGGLGSMGFGLPAAMGAKVACPDALVINIDGDGSFQMNLQEMGTIHMENIPIKMIILNNQHLGMVAQWEDRFYGSCRGNTVLTNVRVDRPYPDFVTIAKGYDIPGLEVYEESEIIPALETMLKAEGSFLLDIHTGYEEHVLPMIPPGKSYKHIITE